MRIVQEPVTALAARDSVTAAFATRAGFRRTRDGGMSWSDWESGSAAGVRSLAYAGAESLVAAGDGITLVATDPVWDVIARSSIPDTVRSVVMAGGGAGWASGDRGALLGTSDSGASWDPYRVNLELNALRGDLAALSMIDPGHAVTGSGTSLVRFLPDAAGPLFRYGIAANPYLPYYVDLHVTAGERLLGDTLEIAIDDVPVVVDLFDSEGFLYRVHYRIPAEPGERRMVTRGRDFAGNERVDTRFLGTAMLDAEGNGLAVWGGEALAVRGTGMGAVCLLELADEAPPYPDGEAL